MDCGVEEKNCGGVGGKNKKFKILNTIKPPVNPETKKVGTGRDLSVLFLSLKPGKILAFLLRALLKIFIYGYVLR